MPKKSLRSVRYVCSVYSVQIIQIIQIIQITSRDLSYHFLLYGSTGSILDRAYINQLASADSSPSSRNTVLKLSVIPLTSTCCNTPINPALAMCYNCNKKGYFALSCPELRDIGDIKEIEEGEMSNKLGKGEPQGKTPPQGTLLILKRLI